LNAAVASATIPATNVNPRHSLINNVDYNRVEDYIAGFRTLEHGAKLMSVFECRRVVTGLNTKGQSCFIFNGPPPGTLGVSRGTPAVALWQTKEAHASNEGAAEAAPEPFDLSLAPGATKFLMREFAPVPDAASLSLKERTQRARAASVVSEKYRVGLTSDHPGMHVTDTIDYIAVIHGEITLVMEDGEQELRAGDVVVDRGVAHAWENRGVEPAVIIAVLIDAAPLPHRHALVGKAR
jgi:mannose-6-phosphate isomerase-like protein (cupin superfamily)